MIKIYNTYTMDWMNYLIIDEELTYHHIKKVEEEGKTTLDNGALLTNRAHEYLHKIERLDKDIYNKINNVFKEINTSKQEPTKEQRLIIDLLLYEFELRNVNKIIKKKANIGKKRHFLVHQKRIDSQLGKIN